MLMANIDKGVQKKLHHLKKRKEQWILNILDSCQETKSNKGIYTTPIRRRLQGKWTLWTPRLTSWSPNYFNVPPPPFNAGATYHSLCKEGGGEEGVQSQILKKK